MAYLLKICWSIESGQKAEMAHLRKLAYKQVCYFCFLDGESCTLRLKKCHLSLALLRTQKYSVTLCIKIRTIDRVFYLVLQCLFQCFFCYLKDRYLSVSGKIIFWVITKLLPGNVVVNGIGFANMGPTSVIIISAFLIYGIKRRNVVEI